MHRTALKTIFGIAACLSLAISQAQAAEDFEMYKKVDDLSGNLNSIGSDTLLEMMQDWTTDFKKMYSKVNVTINQKGSATAPPALISGLANIAPMSRKMTDEETSAFEIKNGYKPTAVRVAIDAIAIYVEKNNPIPGLSLPQVDAIFSTGKTCGYKNDIAFWKDLNIAGPLADKEINLYGRNSESGTHAFLKEKGLCQGEYKKTIKEYSDSVELVKGVAQDPSAIGYSGIGFLTDGVRTVALAREQNQPYIEASLENVGNAKYPLSRFLFIYVNKPPAAPLSTLELEFLKYVLSAQGQEVVKKQGFVPLHNGIAAKELEVIMK